MSGLEVIRAGPCATVQDLGRSGYLSQGVSAAGAMDPVAHRIANALVGNPQEAATIEFAFFGGTFKVQTEWAAVAVVGAEFPVKVNGAVHPAMQTLHLRRDDMLEIGGTNATTYGYLAVAGGVDVAPLFGSRSTHLRFRLGGLESRALRPGDVLPVATPETEPISTLRFEAALPETGPIRVTLGPQDDHFSASGIETFLSASWTVTEQRDRMAQILEGPRIAHRDGFNIVSDAVTRGSIQVAGAGMPMILLAERQTTGGYPKIATVISADLPRLVQLPVGAAVSFAAIGIDEAEDAARRYHGWLKRSLSSLTEVSGSGILTSERLLRSNLISGVADAKGPNG